MPSRPLHVIYYLTAHGYGHGVRSTGIMNALRRECPQLHLTIVSALPESFLRNRLTEFPANGPTFRNAAFDLGMIQRDSIRVDLPATLQALQDFVARRPRLLADETEFLRHANADMVVTDIPALPLAAAAQARLPRLAIGNFSWDWIYDACAQSDALDDPWHRVADIFRCDYANANGLLQLPFSPDMSATFSKRIPIPLLARPGMSRRLALAAATGANPEAQWILLSFTTLDWSATALQAVNALPNVEFFTVRPLQWPGHRHLHAVDRERFSFSDVIATVDTVISKPGYGILSDCIANRKSLIYAEREDFAEYPILAQAIPRYLRNVHIPAVDLYAGRLAPSLDALRHAPPPPEHLPDQGDTIAAQHILHHASSR